MVSTVEQLGDALQWRHIGPSRGGRVVAVAGDPVDPGVFYFGACGGGVWKTTDGGAYWRNVSDAYFDTSSVGAIAVAPSDRNVIYVGTGEACVRNDVGYGDGVYRSNDGGRTWSHAGLEATRHIARVRIHPKNPSLIYAAALGDIFGPSQDRGVYRSTDAGRTWKQVLFRDERSGAADLWLDPDNPELLFATLWEAVRRPWEMVSGGPGSGLFRSTDGGDTWTELTGVLELPEGPVGRIGVVGAAGRSGRVWALVEATEPAGGTYRSEDGGETWARCSENRGVQGRPWYYSHLVADPVDPNTVWALNFALWRSIDGGVTFDRVNTPHGDNHDLWIDPTNTRRLIEGNDGGACVSYNGGETFSTIYNQPTAAFYHLTVDKQFPYRVSATQQDNSAIRVPSRSREEAIPFESAERVGHSESGFIAVDPLDDDIIYSGAVGSSGGGGGPLLRHDHHTGHDHLVTIWPELGIGEDPAQFKHRFNWTYPILFSPADPKALYAGGERVFRSTDQGQSWEAVSPDLTRADPEKLKASGGPITKDTSGAETYATITFLAFTPDGKSLWAGTDDGRVHRTDDDGANWEELTPNIPEWAWINGIEPDPHHPGTVYLSATRYRLGDRKPYLLVTTDNGRTWAEKTDGIDADDYLRTVKADPHHPGVVFVGSERRSYVSLDGGEHWHPFRLNMPAVPIYDFAVVDDDLVAASHGRSFWILDGLHVLGKLAEQGGSFSGPQLLAPEVTYRFPSPGGLTSSGAGAGLAYLGTVAAHRKPGAKPKDKNALTILNGGENPPDGVTLRWFLPEAVEEGSLALTVLDASGAEMRSLPKEALETGAGFHRATWDLRVKGAEPPPGADPGEVEKESRGPLVPPGTYQAHLVGPGIDLTREFEIRADPRLRLPEGALTRQYEIQCRIRDQRNRVTAAIGRLRSIRDQVARWKDDQGIGEQAGSVLQQLDALERRLTQPDAKDDADRLKFPAGLDAKLGALSDLGDAQDGDPTKGTYEVFEELSGRADAAIADLDSLVAGPVTDLDRKIRESGTPLVSA